MLKFNSKDLNIFLKNHYDLAGEIMADNIDEIIDVFTI